MISYIVHDLEFEFTGVEGGAETFSPTARGASVPSLGLSNKAVFEGDKTRNEEEDRHVKDLYPDHYFTAEDYSRPPTEEALAQNTLWPELQKLYGHGYEIFSLASCSGADGAQWDNSGVQTTITYFTQYFMEISVSMASEGHV